MRNVKAILFDLDNTLIYTDPLQTYRENNQREELENNIHLSSLYNPVHNLLKLIVSKGIPLGIVTNSPRWYAEKLISYHEIDFFGVMVCYDDVGYLGVKPSPDGIKLAINQLNLVGYEKDIIYIGDKGDDFIAAYSSGVKPVAPSWASREPINTPPAAIVQSDYLVSCFDDISQLSLIAEMVANENRFDFYKKQLNFLPLDENGNVVALDKDQVRLISLGRYFSQKNQLTATLHEKHQLSKDIYKKEEEDDYVIPMQYVDLMAHVVNALPDFISCAQGAYFEFDFITVIPSKPGKNPRLERMLREISEKTNSKERFIPDLFVFSANSRSLKSLGGRDNRERELSDTFHINTKYISHIRGKRILVIDDVVTTGATFFAAFDLLKSQGCHFNFGVCLAKTVTIHDERKMCSECGRVMRVRRGRYGIHFYGCTGYNDRERPCSHTEHILEKDCPVCGAGMIKKHNRYRDVVFLGCSEYPECNYTEDLEQL